MIPGWCSKRDWQGKAHYVQEDESTACSSVNGPWGIAMGLLLTCAWKDLDPNDHLCDFCRKAYPRTCRCGRCRVTEARS